MLVPKERDLGTNGGEREVNRAVLCEMGGPIMEGRLILGIGRTEYRWKGAEREHDGIRNQEDAGALAGSVAGDSGVSSGGHSRSRRSPRSRSGGEDGADRAIDSPRSDYECGDSLKGQSRRL